MKVNYYLLAIFTDSVWIKVWPSAQTSAGPVKIIFARNVVVNMPPVTVGHVLGPIGVNKTLHVDHGVCQGVVQLLSEDNFASNRVCEGGYRSHHLLNTEMNTNQTGLLKSLDRLEGGVRNGHKF